MGDGCKCIASSLSESVTHVQSTLMLLLSDWQTKVDGQIDWSQTAQKHKVTQNKKRNAAFKGYMASYEMLGSQTEAEGGHWGASCVTFVTERNYGFLCGSTSHEAYI